MVMILMVAPMLNFAQRFGDSKVEFGMTVCSLNREEEVCERRGRKRLEQRDRDKNLEKNVEKVGARKTHPDPLPSG